MRHEFERVFPEKVGISSSAVAALVDSLSDGTVEPHGIMIMRHGKVCAEGWWKPYAPGLVHGMQSLTKTYTATAIGIAYTEGILDLDERIVDIFPDEASGSSQKFLQYQTIRHLLMMATGAEKMSDFQGNWIENYMSQPLTSMPGTKFFYNSVASTLLGEIIRRKTGLTLHEYLTPSLFEKLGICADHIRWMRLKDGMEIGGSGIFTTLDDNLRLAKLYLDGGVFGGKRILAEDFVTEACRKQLESHNIDGGRESSSGYGYQIWMCSKPGVFRMSGAMGQHAIVDPKNDLIIVYSGSQMNTSSDRLLAKFWEFLDNGLKGSDIATADPNGLKRKLSTLSLPAPVCSPYGDKNRFMGTYRIIHGCFQIEPMTGGIMQPYFPCVAADEIKISWGEDVCILSIMTGGRTVDVTAGLDGVARLNHLEFFSYPVHLLYASAHFFGEKLIFELRWVETCFSFSISCEWKDEKSLILEKVYHGIDPDKNADHQFIAVK